MNILAWLRKFGYESLGLGFRDRPIGFEVVRDLNRRAPEHPPAAREVLLQVSTAPKRGAVPRQRRLEASLPRKCQATGSTPGDERSPRQLMLITRSVARPERHRPPPLLGRDAELGLLLEASRQAATGRGQVVLLSGEAGIGKSRIVHELYQRRMSHPQTTLWHHCSSEHNFTPFHGVVGLLHQIGGSAQEPEERLATLEALLAEAPAAPDQAIALLAGLPGVDLPGRYPQPNLTPKRLRSRTFEILLALFERLAKRQMVLAVYEDLQWADASTLEFLRRMVDRIRDLPVLALMTFRPEFAPSWDGCGHSVQLALARLAGGHCQALIDHLSEDEILAEPVVEHVIACSCGVPLLVEELTKATLQVTSEANRDESGDAAAAVMIPSDLAEALTMRLASSPDAGVVARIGAVIGCEFSHELLAALAGWPGDQLQAALDRLVALELVNRCGASAPGRYAFKHALLRDAAYQSLPGPARRSLHGVIARLLEERCPEGTASTPALLAQHYAAAGLVEPAVACWLHAAGRAAEQSAHQEAIATFSRGLEMLDTIPSAPEPLTQRAELLGGLARTLAVTEGPAASEVAQACGLARQLCERAEEAPQLFPTVRGLWDHYNTRADFEAACDLAQRCQKLAAIAQDPGLLTEADFCLGVSSLFVGEVTEARERLNRSVVRGEAQQRQDLVAGEARDPRIISLVHLAHALWLGGYPDQASSASQEAVESARAAGHPFTLAYALLGAGWVCQLRREVDATRAFAVDAIACAAQEDLPAFLAMAEILREWTLVDADAAGRVAAAAAIRKALDNYRVAGVEIARPYLLGLLAEVHGASETELALKALEEGVELADATGEHWYEPEIRRQEGKLLLRQSITNRRVTSARFCQAIAVAQQQGGKSLELRATVSLARLWSDLGRRSQARDLLAPVYGWFKEGFDAADLVEARALLDELS